MDRILRRVRGTLIRMVMRRWPALIVGALFTAPAAAFYMIGESWYTDGLALVLGTTGTAFIVAALGGRRGDWIDPDGPTDSSRRNP